jgi:DNA-directed RNA polymerase sigma subunit (sigma70/sigma32)
VPAAAFEKTKKAKAKHTTKPDRRRDEVIRERRRMGDKVAAIAKDYGISEERVRQIARGVKVEEPIEEEVAQ